MTNKLINACFDGDFDAAKQELETNKANLNESVQILGLTSQHRLQATSIHKSLITGFMTPINAVILGTQNPNILRLLLEQGADVNSFIVKQDPFATYRINAFNLVCRLILEMNYTNQPVTEDLRLCLILLLKYKINTSHIDGYFCKSNQLISLFTPRRNCDLASLAIIIIAALLTGNNDLLAAPKDEKRMNLLTPQFIEQYAPLFGIRGSMPFVRQEIENLVNQNAITRAQAIDMQNAFAKAELTVPHSITDLPLQLQKALQRADRRPLSNLISQLAYHLGRRATPLTRAELRDYPMQDDTKALLDDEDENRLLAFTESPDFLKNILCGSQDKNDINATFLAASIEFSADIYSLLAEIAADPDLKDTAEYAQIVSLLSNANALTETERVVIQAGKAQSSLHSKQIASVHDELEGLKEENGALRAEVTEMKGTLAQMQAKLDAITNLLVALQPDLPGAAAAPSTTSKKRSGLFS